MNHHNMRACNRCPKRSPPPYRGRMDCLYDPARPVDTQERLRTGFCPMGRFVASDAEIERAAAAERVSSRCCDPPPAVE